MKLSKIAISILSISLVTACSNDSPNVEVKGDTEDTTIVKKHESVELPVTIYKQENYFSGEDVTFIRTIESVKADNFTESTAIDFTDRYDNQIKQMNLDLTNDYKRIAISMTHNIEGKTTKTPMEAFILDENSEILFNNEPIQDEVVTKQLKLSTLDYRMGSTHDKKGEIVFAIPKKYMEGILQLKTISRNNENNEVIYIDLN
ncbi:hypothetical protein SFC57_24060 [Niallia circulans]|uniref:hypothetical protein n=1 Tax=Bacillaceae TaxID=186817 RepID=UPI003978035D